MNYADNRRQTTADGPQPIFLRVKPNLLSILAIKWIINLKKIRKVSFGFFYSQLKILFFVKYPGTKRVVLVHGKLNKLL